MDDLQRQIRYALRCFLDGTTSFEAFEEWFVDATWDISRDHPDLADLVYEIEGHIFALTGGRKTERELKRCLRPLAPDWWDAVDATLAVPVASTPENGSTAKKASRKRSKPKLGATVPLAVAGT